MNITDIRGLRQEDLVWATELRACLKQKQKQILEARDGPDGRTLD